MELVPVIDLPEYLVDVVVFCLLDVPQVVHPFVGLPGPKNGLLQHGVGILQGSVLLEQIIVLYSASIDA